MELACEQRAQWARASINECTTCIAEAISPPCGCVPNGGRCLGQNQADINEASCTDDVRKCFLKCNNAECGCVDNCYASAPSCRTVQSAVDGCVVAECDSVCR